MTDTYVPTRAERIGARIGLFVFTLVAGSAGGFMLGTMLAKIVGSITDCNPGEGLPACNWNQYAFSGALLGAVLIPSLAFWRLRASARGDRSQ